jgi:hypothetical protein
MRWSIFGLVLMPTLLLAKHLTLTITPNYPLSVINAQLICASLHANISTTAINKLETLQDLPFVCTFFDDGNGTKQLKIVFTLKDQ